jgi:hypothetical protein
MLWLAHPANYTSHAEHLGRAWCPVGHRDMRHFDSAMARAAHGRAPKRPVVPMPALNLRRVVPGALRLQGPVPARACARRHWPTRVSGMRAHRPRSRTGRQRFPGPPGSEVPGGTRFVGRSSVTRDLIHAPPYCTLCGMMTYAILPHDPLPRGPPSGWLTAAAPP